MSKFWITRIIGMLVVILIAASILLFGPDPTAPATVVKPNKPKEKSSSVAENVSRFYASFKQTSSDPIKEKYGEFVIPLENQVINVEEAIKGSTDRIYPPLDNWQGEIKERPFAKGETVKNQAEAFARSEGFHLVWDLKQDYIVLDRFVSSNTLVGMLDDVAIAVDANYDSAVLVYFCFRKRALVITERSSEYFLRNCQKSYGSMYKEK